MARSNFKKFMMVVAAAAMTMSAQAQYLRSSYFMEGTSSRLALNPGLQPMRGYFNVPVLGAFNASVSSNVLGINDMFDLADGGGEDLYMNNHLYNRLKHSNDVNCNLNTDLLSFGWFKGKNFWSVNVGLRMDFGARASKGMFDFMRNVNGFDLEDILGHEHEYYDMGNQQVRMSAYGEIGLGFSRRITEKLTVGGRAKVLLGLARAELNIDKADIYLDIPDIPGYDGTIESINKINPSDWYGRGYSYDIKGNIMTTVKGGGFNYDDRGMIREFDFDASDMGLAGAGFGIDLGASYDITDNLTVSAALLDLGFLKWKSGETSVGTAEADFDEVITEDNYKHYLGGDFLSMERFNFSIDENAHYKSKTRLSSTLLLAGEYAFFNRKLSVGAMYTAHFVKPKALHDVTLSATYRPRNWFNIAGSYSPVLAGGKSIGLAMKLGPLFLGTDYMYFGDNSKSVNAFIGLSIPMGSKRKAYSEL